MNEDYLWQSLARENRIVEAIKEYRRIYDSSLIDAKNKVQGYMASLEKAQTVERLRVGNTTISIHPNTDGSFNVKTELVIENDYGRVTRDEIFSVIANISVKAALA